MGNISNKDKEKTQSYIIEAMSWLADAVENGIIRTQTERSKR